MQKRLEIVSVYIDVTLSGLRGNRSAPTCHSVVCVLSQNQDGSYRDETGRVSSAKFHRSPDSL